MSLAYNKATATAAFDSDSGNLWGCYALSRNGRMPGRWLVQVDNTHGKIRRIDVVLYYNQRVDGMTAAAVWKRQKIVSIPAGTWFGIPERNPGNFTRMSVKTKLKPWCEPEYGSHRRRRDTGDDDGEDGDDDDYLRRCAIARYGKVPDKGDSSPGTLSRTRFSMDLQWPRVSSIGSALAFYGSTGFAVFGKNINVHTAPKPSQPMAIPLSHRAFSAYDGRPVNHQQQPRLKLPASLVAATTTKNDDGKPSRLIGNGTKAPITITVTHHRQQFRPLSSSPFALLAGGVSSSGSGALTTTAESAAAALLYTIKPGETIVLPKSELAQYYSEHIQVAMMKEKDTGGI